MPHPYVMWTGSGSYANGVRGTSITVVIGTVPAMALTSKARLYFACHHNAANLRPGNIQYRRADGVVLGYGVLENFGEPGTPFGGSVIGSIAGIGSELGSGGGTFEVVAYGPPDVPFPPPGDSGVIVAAIIDTGLGPFGEQIDNNLDMYSAIGPNGGTTVDGACVNADPARPVTTREWEVGVALMTVDHSQTPALVTGPGGSDPGYQVVVEGVGGAIAIIDAPSTFDIFQQFCAVWQFPTPSTFCRVGAAVRRGLAASSLIGGSQVQFVG